MLCGAAVSKLYSERIKVFQYLIDSLMPPSQMPSHLLLILPHKQCTWTLTRDRKLCEITIMSIHPLTKWKRSLQTMMKYHQIVPHTGQIRACNPYNVRRKDGDCDLILQSRAFELVRIVLSIRMAVVENFPLHGAVCSIHRSQTVIPNVTL
jgi:hypothetical protein